MTKVYVLTEEPYHDNSRVVGAYGTAEAAETAAPEVVEWIEGGFYLERWGARFSGYDKTEEQDHFRDVSHLIYEFELQP